MASQTMHIVEYRTEPPPPSPAFSPAPVTAPVSEPDVASSIEARNAATRAVGLGQSVDVLV